MTIVVTFKEWLKYKSIEEANSAVVIVNGKKIRASKIEIKDGHIYADGIYVCPTDIEAVSCEDPNKS